MPCAIWCIFRQFTLKSGTFGVPELVLLGSGTAWYKFGTSREIRDGWQPYALPNTQPTMSKHTHTHTRLTALCPGLPSYQKASTRKVKSIWILLKQETVSGGGINSPAPHHSVLYRPEALPAAQPTASKH